MKYTDKISNYKQSGNTRFFIINILISILVIQACMICGTSPQIYMPTALAIANVSCTNPTPPNNGASTPSATPGIALINEVLTSPQSQWTCTAPNQTPNQIHPWVEIYNPQTQPLDLYAARAILSYAVQGTQQDEDYFLPSGSTIAAHGFLATFPFTNLPPNSYTQISSVRLIISQTIIDQVPIPYLADDTSYARIPDGSNHWQITATPTIASSNTISSAATTPTRKTKQKSTRTPQKSTHTARRGGTSNDETSTDETNPGVQPTWDALRLPSSGPNNTATQQRNSSPSPANSTTSADPLDLLKKILLTLLIILLFCTLLWGWRLYRKKENPFRGLRLRSPHG
jgi:hypothetical protein